MGQNRSQLAKKLQTHSREVHILAHELRAGKLPACAEKCSMAAVYFGHEYEDAVTNNKGETIQLSKISKQGAGYRLLEELGTVPRVYFLPPANRQYAAPGEAKPEEKKS